MGLQGERVFAFAAWVVGAKNQQARAAGPDVGGAEHRRLRPVRKAQIGRLPRVAQGAEQLPKPIPLQVDALGTAALPVEIPAEAQVVRGKGAQFGVGCAGAAGFGGLAPALDGGADVAGEDFRQIVMAVKLVLVMDAG